MSDVPTTLESCTAEELWQELGKRYANCVFAASGPLGSNPSNPEVIVLWEATPAEMYGLSYVVSAAAEKRVSMLNFGLADDDDDCENGVRR